MSRCGDKLVRTPRPDTVLLIPHFFKALTLLVNTHVRHFITVGLGLIYGVVRATGRYAYERI